MSREIDDPRSFWEAARFQMVCGYCGRAGHWEAHHAVQKQTCRRAGAPLHSPRNALRLCKRCHDRHTTHQDKVPMTALTDDNIAFAREYLGAGPAYEYFVRSYAGEDPRVTHLIEAS